MGTRQQMTELNRRRRRARFKSGANQEAGALTEYRGRESYEQQSSEGRGGQSDVFDQGDYPPRNLARSEEPPEDDGQLVTSEDRLH